MAQFRWLTAGESHGPGLVAIVDGVPAGLPLLASQIDLELARRQRGYGRGGRMKIETDHVIIQSGVRGGETLGSPISFLISNKDYANWVERMKPETFNVLPEPVLRPRPGHADLAGGLKYNRHDLRDVLERASARETAARVAVGAVAKRILECLGIDVFSHVTSIGSVYSELHKNIDWNDIRDRARSSDLNCADVDAEQRMRETILEASHEGDTLGGTFEIVATGVVPGLGSHVQWDRKLDGRIAQAIMCIQAIKGVEIGMGFAAAFSRGSQVHDSIQYDSSSHMFTRTSNHAGGLEGGISNGAPIIVRAAMKPIATLRKALPSVCIDTKERSDATFERSDICAVAAASVVGEAMLAIVLADAVLEKFGGDSVNEFTRNYRTYQEQIEKY